MSVVTLVLTPFANLPGFFTSSLMPSIMEGSAVRARMELNRTMLMLQETWIDAAES
jgi:hypothetical protein